MLGKLIESAEQKMMPEVDALLAIREGQIESILEATDGIKTPELRTAVQALAICSATALVLPARYALERVIKGRPAEEIARDEYEWANRFNFWRRQDTEPLDRLLKEKPIGSK